jgi:hypothetical protein
LSSIYSSRIFFWSFFPSAMQYIHFYLCPWTN